jgi:hypothetical protein
MATLSNEFTTLTIIHLKAAFSLTNIACHGTKYIQALPNNVLLPGITTVINEKLHPEQFSDSIVNRLFGICAVRGPRAD